jgi:hypothetical protein
MAYLNLRQWKYETPEDDAHVDALTQHGAPPARVLYPALVDALTTLIVPGLKQLGIPTRELEAWLAEGASTDRAPTELV